MLLLFENPAEMLQIFVKRRVPVCSTLVLSFPFTSYLFYHPPGEVHPRQIFLHWPGVQERDLRCHPSRRVSSDRGGGGRLWADSGRPHGHPGSVLYQARYRLTEDAGFFPIVSISKRESWCRNPTNAELKSLHPNDSVWSQSDINAFSIYLFSGITKLRFKPAYNPYTEPSMEVFSYHEGKLDQRIISWP